MAVIICLDSSLVATPNIATTAPKKRAGTAAAPRNPETETRRAPERAVSATPTELRGNTRLARHGRQVHR